MQRLLIPVVLLLAFVRASEALEPLPEHPLALLRAGHPRLMLTKDQLASLKKRAETDAVLQRYVADTLAQAEAYLNAPPLTYDLVGPRLLHVSRACLDRVYALALAWRWTEEMKFADKAIENARTVCAFKDWNPSHFLDVAEMAHAVSIVYDWLYPVLEEEDKTLLEQKLHREAFENGFEEYANWTGWPDSEHNWNQVCNSGLVIAALALGEVYPEEAERILHFAYKSYPHSLSTYAPDGAWPEGPSYWHYATAYTAYGLAAMSSALNTDFGLSEFPGMAETGLFPIYATGPTGLYLNFADSGERNKRGPMPVQFWLAQRYGNAQIAASEHAMLTDQKAEPQHVMWYLPPTAEEAPPASLDRLFRGPVPVAVFRSGWNNPDAIFLGVKGGYNQVNHGQLDLGNFEFDALGVRWASDLGSDNYNLPGYFDKKVGGKRWQYYRMRSTSHSVPLINDEDQKQDAVAEVLAFEPGETPFLLLDLSSAYPAAARVTRKAGLIERRSAALIEDTFDLAAPAGLTWGLTTDAEISIEGNRALMSLEGRQCEALLESPAEAIFIEESAEQKAPEKENKGVRRLLVQVNAPAGELKLRVVLRPLT